jgi:hypothetical protein
MTIESAPPILPAAPLDPGNTSAALRLLREAQERLAALPDAQRPAASRRILTETFGSAGAQAGLEVLYQLARIRSGLAPEQASRLAAELGLGGGPVATVAKPSGAATVGDGLSAAGLALLGEETRLLAAREARGVRAVAFADAVERLLEAVAALHSLYKLLHPEARFRRSRADVSTLAGDALAPEKEELRTLLLSTLEEGEGQAVVTHLRQLTASASALYASHFESVHRGCESLLSAIAPERIESKADSGRPKLLWDTYKAERERLRLALQRFDRFYEDYFADPWRDSYRKSMAKGGGAP